MPLPLSLCSAIEAFLTSWLLLTGHFIYLWPLFLAKKTNNARPKRRAPRRQRIPRPPLGNFFEKDEYVQRPSPLDRQVVRMTKIVERTNIVTSTTAAVHTGLAFKLSDCFDASEIASVFDQYRLDRVDIKMLPNVTESISSTSILGRNYTVIDFDDANALTSLTDYGDYSSARTWAVTDPMQLTLVPHYAVGAYSGVFSSFANRRPGWIDIASPGVEHYGVKVGCGTTTTAVTYTVTCRYHFSFRMMH